MNWRNDGTSHLFYQAGANLPLLWVKDSLGDDCSALSTIVAPRSLFIDEIFDEENVNKGIITKEQWKKEREEATIFKYYDESDLAPYEAVKKGKRKKLLLDSIVARNFISLISSA